jgi:CO/xanthine dehydrogenase FAD-binding subunit
MKNFAHVNATSAASAVKLLDSDHARPIAGGTDLLTLMKPEIITPDRLVNLKTIPEMDYIRFNEKEGLKLGALATLSEIAASEIVRERYPLLSRAVSVSASRDSGTGDGRRQLRPGLALLVLPGTIPMLVERR